MHEILSVFCLDSFAMFVMVECAIVSCNSNICDESRGLFRIAKVILKKKTVIM